jgi:hypothetical protein
MFASPGVIAGTDWSYLSYKISKISGVRIVKELDED